MKYALLICLCLASVPSAGAGDSEILLGERIVIHSDVLGEDRGVMVHLPDGYEDGTDRYPVVYVLDGRTHFLHVSGAADFLAGANTAPAMIVVGILNTHRTLDMTGLPDPEGGEGDLGGAERFTAFIGDELMPQIDKRYRTEDFNVLMGHSLAGYFTVHTLLNHPDLFDAHIAASPSLYRNDGMLVEKMLAACDRRDPLDGFLYFTHARDYNVDIVRSVNRFAGLLAAQAPPELEWKFACLPGDIHPTTSYRAFYDGLEWLFAGWLFDATAPGADPDRMRSQYAALAAKYGFAARPSEAWVNLIGYEMLRAGRTEEAIGYFEYCADSRPGSANAYDSLGEAYMTAGETGPAIRNYEKSLELDPDNRNAAQMLKKLRGGKR